MGRSFLFVGDEETTSLLCNDATKVRINIDKCKYYAMKRMFFTIKWIDMQKCVKKFYPKAWNIYPKASDTCSKPSDIYSVSRNVKSIWICLVLQGEP